MPEIQEFDQNEDLIVGEDSSSEEFDAGLSKWFSHVSRNKL